MATPNGGEDLRFGAFELCSGTGELRKDGAVVKLQPQPFRVLQLLASHAGELVTRAEIREALWSGETTVEFDQGLNFCIRQIRAALGDDAREPQFIETLPKRGYRFIRPVGQARDEERRAARRTPARWIATSIIAMAVAATTVFLFFWTGRNSGVHDLPRAILVRPFVSLGLSEQEAWFGDALTQQLIGTLAEAKTLRVVPWSSSMALKGQSAGLPELGKRFHVDAILEGSVRRSGNRLLVATDLVDVRTERILWSHQDERDGHDLAKIQDEIFAAIAGTLKMRVTEDTVPAARRRPQDLETYNLYLKALYLGDQFSADGVGKSVEDFREVIQRAPGYAPAYAGLANVLTILPFVQPVPAKLTLAQARDAAKQAIALDPSLVMAHAALAHSFFNDWNWRDAEKEFQEALSLDPDSAMARHLYGLFLASQGRAEEAIREAQRATELAPTSGLIAYSLATVFLHSGRYDEAIAQSRRTLELYSNFQQAYSDLARAYTMKGMPREAMEVLEQWARYAPEPAVQPLWMANALASAGERDQARRLITKWRESSGRSATPPMAYAAALLACGEKEEALKALRQSVERHVPSMIWIKATPELAAIRSDPRFATILAGMAEY